MVETALHGAGAAPDIEALLQEDLQQADLALANARPILRHLLGNDDHSIFSDAIVARVRGMLRDLARQLVTAMAEAGGHSDIRVVSSEACDELANAFSDSPVLLAHAHALAVEWQLTERLQTRLSLDPVLSPLVQSLIASSDPATSATAMAALAAQARFGQSQRRMELPLTELPGDLFHLALVTMRAYVADHPEADRNAARAEETLRQRHEERRSRLGLIERLITALRGEAAQALSVEHAGVAMFLTALSIGSGQDRDLVVLTTSESQAARLALALAACGLKPDAVAAQFLALHPEVSLPEGFGGLRPDRAAAILSLSAGGHGR